MTWTEDVVEVGAQPKLCGIRTIADGNASDLLVVILNAGLVHRAGPFRLHTQLARHLADQGLASVRIDLSGLGYSTSRAESAGPIEDAKADARELFDAFEQQFGAKRFVLVGLCSGAENAHYIALADPRVVACVFLDGYAYPTFKSRLKHYAIRLPRWGIWVDWFQSRFFPEVKDLGASPEGGLWQVVRPQLDEFSSDIKTLLERNTHLLFLYAGISGVYNYSGQLGDAVPEARSDKCTDEVLPDADHTFTICADRERLLRRIGDWLIMRFPPS